MKKKTKYPNVRFVLREWFMLVRDYNSHNPSAYVMKEANRIKRAAFAELRGK